ncbi:RNA polymerase sigma factor [Penaeicola halotolerans]|uniref:RNA polymerase sigma factor n=1 Tax=Penaeicola halotolerans TaxID=2793196 RepID=UPI001CF87658|nr:sigma-70 family RNA polymerase sigma factor [Penaeicola halotolerans]
MEDKDLIRDFLVPATRDKAFRELVKKYSQKVYWMIRKMVINHEDADDLTQDTFVKVYKNLDKFQQDASLYTWIYRIATNETLHHLNKAKRMYLEPLEDTHHELSHSLNQQDLDGDEVSIKLQHALLKLPEKQRLVFNMKYFDNLKYEEISEITGTSVGALKTSYHLAVKKIEDILTQD